MGKSRWTKLFIMVIPNSAISEISKVLNNKRKFKKDKFYTHREEYYAAIINTDRNKNVSHQNLYALLLSQSRYNAVCKLWFQLGFFFLKKFTFFYLFIYWFMTVLGLRFCARAFSSCGKRGPLFIAVRGPLTVAAPLVAEHRLQTRRLSSCGSRA